MLNYELELFKKGISLVAGVDEVGRGPLAGPMVVAAVIFKKEDLLQLAVNNASDSLYAHINDSKQVSQKNREVLSEFIKKKAHKYSIQTIEHEVIDSKGISQATQIGFFNSIKELGFAEHILTDNFRINMLSEKMQTNIPKGDTLSITIAAASIIAKVYRDKIMDDYAKVYTNYGFEKHKGYGTKQHKEAIKQYGPCEIHRKSFSPIKSYF